MRSKIFFTIIIISVSVIAAAQPNNVNLANMAWEKGNLERAMSYASEALQAAEALTHEQLLKARLIRGKAGARLSYDALVKGTDEEMRANRHIPLQAYHDLKFVLDSDIGDLKNEVTAEFTKLSHALLLSGSDFDNAFTENSDDSSLIQQSIENYSASIELGQMTGNEKYKTYYYRGDVLLMIKEYDMAVVDFKKAMDLFAAAQRKTADLGIGDLGYRLAYTLAGVFNEKNGALDVIEKTRKLMKTEMERAESLKEKLGERYNDYVEEFDLLTTDLDKLEISIKK